jgi:hypothetical protein
MSTRNLAVSFIQRVKHALLTYPKGLDQRKLFIAAKEWLPKLGYKEVKSSSIKEFH